MEPLKPRDKVTQHMTRDGLTLEQGQNRSKLVKDWRQQAHQDPKAPGKAKDFPPNDLPAVFGIGR